MLDSVDSTDPNSETADPRPIASSPELQEAVDLVDRVARPKGFGGHRPNEQQRLFAQAFVMNGGNATDAARVAGYAHGDTYGPRLLLNGNIRAEIERLSVALISAKLPQLIAAALKLIEETTDDKARITAIFGLLDRAGLKPKTGPLVQVNNTTNTQINSGAAVATIMQEVWQKRSARLSGDLSAIVGGMPDHSAAQIGTEHSAEPDALEHAPADRGGDGFQGPVAGPVSIPTPSPENSPQTEEGD